MPSERPLFRLEDILDNIERIEHYTAGLSFEQFHSNRQCRDAVERCLLRISEAARKLGTSADEIAPGQPWSDIRAVGNVLRHDYDEIDPAAIWNTVSDHLGPLRGCG